jgi:hypothetical protein
MFEINLRKFEFTLEMEFGFEFKLELQFEFGQDLE